MGSKLIIKPEFKDALSRAVSYIEKYASQKNVEVEFRIGYLEDKAFNTDVSEEYYNKILGRLRTTPKWEHTETVSSTDYFVADKRYTVTSDGIICIRKSKLVHMDFKYENTPFDVRFCISKEDPVAPGKFSESQANYSRKKTRDTFKHKFWKYDISKIETVDNSVTDVSYEVELDCVIGTEPITPDMWNYIIYSGLLKVSDLVGMCEPISEESKLKFLSVSEKTRK